MPVQAAEGFRTGSRSWRGRTTSAWLAAVLCCVLSSSACSRRSTLPAALSDQDFWRLVEALSEPAGAFTLSDNVVSNEPHYADTVRWLRPSGGAYIGVGPEQNFTYIAGLRPAMAFIIDIRRENLDLHLLYKALFELSSDRADFVSLLFSRPRPAGLQSRPTVDEIFERFDTVAPSFEQFTRTATLVRQRLRITHGLPLTEADVEWIDRVLRAFYTDGPKIDYYGPRVVDAVRPSYRQLMTAKDIFGRRRSFLANEDGFRFVKGLQSRNLILPVVGDFAGRSAIRRVGDHLRAHGERLYAFYGSNVGVYLSGQQMVAFCANLATLPATSRTWFIDSDGMRTLASKLRACSPPSK